MSSNTTILRSGGKGDAGAGVSADSSLWQFAALGTVLLASCGHLLIKLGLMSVHGGATAGLAGKIALYLTQPAVVAGLAIYGLGTLIWIYAVSQRSISFLYPLTALNYVIVTLGGWYWFEETIRPGRWLGIAVVVAGVALLQLSARGDNS
jgi:drug/metabolite transporter (DMT)-like permease